MIQMRLSCHNWKKAQDLVQQLFALMHADQTNTHTHSQSPSVGVSRVGALHDQGHYTYYVLADINHNCHVIEGNNIMSL